MGYQPALDGTRAVAVLVVMLHHSFLDQELLSGLNLGVTTFFVSSGFLITVLLLQEGYARGGVSLGHFYRRRALRLLPALTVYVTVFAALKAALALTSEPPDPDVLWEGLVGAAAGVFYLTNVLLGYDLWSSMPIDIGHLWTLATQEQFYLLWPPVLALAFARRIPPRVLMSALAVAIVVIAANRMSLAAGGAPNSRIKFAPDVTFDAILLGCLAGVAFTSGRLPRWVVNARVMPAVGAASALVAAGVLLSTTDGLVLYGVLLPLFTTAVVLVVLAAVLHPSSLVNRGLSAPPIVFIGRISYSLFLWQQLFIFTLGPRLSLPVAWALAIGTAYLSFRYVEQPFLRRKQRDRKELEERVAVGDASPAEPGPPPAPDSLVPARVP